MMSKITIKVRCLSLLTSALVLSACSVEDPASVGAPELGQAQQSIIGGFLAPSPELDHFGALVAINRANGSRNAFCGATLISADTAVTAKHCARNVLQLPARGQDLFFGVGPNGIASERLIPIAAVELAPGDTGGFLGIGSDVAVVHLDAATGLTPAVPRALDASFEGVSMVAIGYGVFGASGANDDRRRIGRVTVAATSGNALEHMVGSFENFVEYRLTGNVSDADFLAQHGSEPEVAARLPALEIEFDLPLLPGHEAVTGLDPGDTQLCRGDSGGPLALFAADGTWQVHGVASATLDSERLSCDFGTIFATFGPEAMAFLEQARAWLDPCGDLGAAAVCEGEVARRCETDLTTGVRRVVEEPCAASEPDAGADSL
ncbi:MAG: trypsin-like serine protease [Polyangiaceae bacterium]